VVKHALGAALLAAATAAAAATMYDRPYALIERGDTSETRNESSVAITKVDGKSTTNPRRTDPLPPGRHVITIHYDSARGRWDPEYRDLEMDLEACTLYRIVAAYPVRTGPDWTPKVYAEPIASCAKKFGLDKKAPAR
jgi:hypothetical protein